MVLRLIGQSNSKIISFNGVKEISLYESTHPAAVKPINTASMNPCWLCLEYIEQLLTLAEANRYAIIRNLFEIPLKHYPEILSLGLSQVKPNCINALHFELSSILMPIFLNNHSNSSFVLHRIWSANHNMLLQGLLDLYAVDKLHISRILDIAQDLKALTVILQESRSFYFMIDLASLAARREFLYLEKWLPGHIKEFKEPFVRVCIDYIKEKTIQLMDPAKQQQLQQQLASGAPLQQPQLEPKILTMFIECLMEESKFLSPELAAEVNLLTNPLKEKRANEIFQNIYHNKISVPNAIILFKKLKQSKTIDKNVFQFIVETLLNEFLYFDHFHEGYLSITGELYGALISNQLLSGEFLAKAEENIESALKRPPHDKVFKLFGLAALNQFKQKLYLPNMQGLTKKLLQINHLIQLVPDIILYTKSPESRGSLNTSASGVLPSNTSYSDQQHMQGSTGGLNMSAPNLPGNNPNAMRMHLQQQQAAQMAAQQQQPRLTIDVILEGLLARCQRQPDESTQDAILFIFNNVSQQNLDEKAKDLKLKLLTEHYPWLAQYIVVKRVSIEPNFHQLYLAFLDKLNLQQLDKFIFNATFSNIDYLLRTYKLIANPENVRNVLKNLGSWLGNITLGKNKPILHKQLDFKKLLIDAYESGNLITIVAFVAKVLAACAHSKLIKPQNAWIMQQLRFLKEIYEIPNIKLAIKFELEILCGILQLELSTLTPTNYLRNQRCLVQPNPDLNLPDKQHLQNSQGQPPQTPVGPPGMLPPGQMGAGLGGLSSMNNLQQPNPLLGVRQSNGASDMDQQLLQQRLPQGLPLNVSGSGLTNQPPGGMDANYLHKQVLQIINKAVNEILSPVVERSVTIACFTTRNLIAKDFCTEQNFERIRQAAHLMVKNLAGNLALVDPLWVNILQNLPSFIRGRVSDPNLEATVDQICSENLELASQLIEKTAVEKAVMEIDENMTQIMQQKQTISPYIRYLPDILSSENGLKPHQWAVYEDFSRPRIYANQINPQQAPSGLPTGQQGSMMPNIPPNQMGQAGLMNNRPGTGIPQQQPPNQAQGLGNNWASIASNNQRPGQGQGASGLPQLNENSYPIQQGNPGAQPATQQPPIQPPPRDANQTSGGAAQWRTAVEQIHEIFKGYIKQLDGKLQQQPPIQPSEIFSYLNQISLLHDRSPSEEETCLGFAKHLFNKLFTCTTPQQLDVYIYILDTYKTKQVVLEITTLYEFLNQDRKFNREVITRLINSKLILLPEFDSHIAQLLANGNEQAFEFIKTIIHRCVNEAKSISTTDLPRSTEMLERFQSKTKKAPQQQQPVQPQRQSNQPQSQPSNNNNQTVGSPGTTSAVAGPTNNTNGKDILKETFEYTLESPEIKEQVQELFEEWKQINLNSPNQQTITNYLSKLQQGILSSPEMSKFFGVCTKLSVQSFLNGFGTVSLDYFAKLVIFLFEFTGNESKAAIIHTTLLVVAHVLISDFEGNPMEFNQQPYHFLFNYWLNELPVLSKNKDVLSWQILSSYCSIFSSLQPLKVIGFSFAWLELISHRHFMPKLLLHSSRKGSAKFQGLLVELLQFLEPFLRNAELNATVRLLYRGTLRVLLVLLHDFPEFLCEYHFSFCDVIPPSCIQMRNLILSAFPRNMRLPDPFTPNLKVDLLPEIGTAPTIESKYTLVLQKNKFIHDVDLYLKNRTPNTFLVDLRSQLLLPPQDVYAIGTKYNVPLINALVLHICIFDLAQQNATSSPNTVAREIFRYLIHYLDAEGNSLPLPFPFFLFLISIHV